ncbi:hypothetical protein [Paenibacillus tepidiphilus]|uniref:hypothetical protein n=1 Tax=Paenibacillus tepidiphilus TaxID=2608683 RepID=UPI00123A05F8|nr:hypothetical protein [Paenibacillus tepidiphilus]
MSHSLISALGVISQCLEVPVQEGVPAWLLGGSCGQMLQGVDLKSPPRDVDLYSDLDSADRLRAKLGRYSLDQAPLEDDSGDCFSLRSRFFIGGIQVELISGFRIWSTGAFRVDIQRILPFAPVADVSGAGALPLIPLAVEWVCCQLRGRQERAVRIAEAMRSNMPAHLPLLKELLAEHRLYEMLRPRLTELADSSLNNLTGQDKAAN